MIDELAVADGDKKALSVPAGYAEKAMASLMQLHVELMDEKERRVDLYRRLMEKEQTIAELRMYVKLLEEKLGQKTEAAAPRSAVSPRVAPAPPPPPAPKVARERQPSDRGNEPIPIRRLAKPSPPPRPAREAAATMPPAGARRASPVEGWKVW